MGSLESSKQVKEFRCGLLVAEGPSSPFSKIPWGDFGDPQLWFPGPTRERVEERILELDC